MNTKLILLKRVRPVVYEVHINKIEQAKNILFCTTDKDFAENIVKSFNNFERVKKQLAKAKNELGVKQIYLSGISMAFKKKLNELNNQVLELQKNKKQWTKKN
jgi:CO dehydrogenase/acetyl-CoA synthase gamma subunit (corrinoid Fe-S protein)